MNRESVIALAAVLLMIGATSQFLRHHSANQRLGAPGVKLVAEPSPVEGGGTVGTNSVWLPERAGEFTSRIAPVAKTVCDTLPKDTTYGHHLYTAPDGFQVDTQVVLMGADRTSLHQPQYCLVGSGWHIDESKAENIRMNRPHAYDLPVTRLTLSGRFQTEHGLEAKRGVFVYWFVSDGKLTAEHSGRMWSSAREQLRTGVLPRWAYVICFAVCAPGAEEATAARVKNFIAIAAPEFQLAAGPEPGETARN